MSDEIKGRCPHCGWIGTREQEATYRGSKCCPACLYQGQRIVLTDKIITPPANPTSDRAIAVAAALCRLRPYYENPSLDDAIVDAVVMIRHLHKQRLTRERIADAAASLFCGTNGTGTWLESYSTPKSLIPMASRELHEVVDILAHHLLGE